MRLVNLKFLLAAGLLCFCSKARCEQSGNAVPFDYRYAAAEISNEDGDVSASVVDGDEMTDGLVSHGSDDDLSPNSTQGESVVESVQPVEGNDDEPGEDDPTRVIGNEIDETPDPTPDFDDDSIRADGLRTEEAYEEKEETNFDVDALLSGSQIVGYSEREDIELDNGEDDDGGSEDETGTELFTTMHKKAGKGTLGKVRTITVIVASKTTVQVCRNFKLVGRTKAWTNAKQIVFKARVGDSITILSKGLKRFYGVAAMIKQGGKRWYTTAGPGGRAFKAIGLKALQKMKKGDLRSPRRKMCFLRYPYAVKDQRTRKARSKTAAVLFKKRARYVWARGAKSTDVIGVRFVVGGDRCKKPKPKPTPKPTAGAARCACRVVRSESKGDCLGFRNKRFTEIANKVGPCRKRKCGLKYECVQPGRRSKIVCVRRFARFEVRPVGPQSKGRCKNVPVRPAQPYYAPYS